ncbi:MAG: PAS domain S-box protein [Bacteroidales bacterium]|nr:PAS domain S-box protein [Bacteroidales bacterium]
MINYEDIQKLNERIDKLEAEKKHLLEFAQQQQQTAEQLHSVIEMSQTGTWKWNVQTGETVFNDQWAAMLGYELSELQPINIETWTKLTHPDDLKIAQNALDKYFNKETPFYEAKFRMKHSAGHWVWVLDRGRVSQWDSNGNPLIMLGTHQEINQIQETELRLEKANRLYAVVSQVNQAIVHSKTQQKLFEEICRVAIDFGKFRMSWIGLLNSETQKIEPVAVAGEENGYLSAMYQISLDKNIGGSGPVGTSIRTNKYFACNDIANDPEMQLWKDEALKRDYHSFIGLPLRLHGQPIAALALYSNQVNFFNPTEIKLLEEVAYDISYALDSIATEAAHAKTIEALTVSEQRFRLFAESAPVGILIVDQNLNFLFASQQFTSILGYTLDDLPNIGLWWEKAYPEPEYQALVMKRWNEYLTNLKFSKSSEQFEPFEFKVCCKDGTFKNIEFHMAIHANTHYILLIDRTERKLVQDRLSASENNFRNLINQMQLGMALHEIILNDQEQPVDYRFLDCNPAYEQLTGLNRSEILGKTVLEVLPNTENIWIENFGKVALTGAPIMFESYARQLDRHYSVKAYQPAPMQFAVLTEDITDQKTNLQKIEDNTQKFRNLSRSATEMLELKNLDSIYAYIAKSLHEQYPDTIILFQNVNHAQHSSKLTHIEGVSEKIKKMAIKLAGSQIYNKEFKLISEHLDFYMSGKLHHFEKGLADFAGNQFPRLAASTLEKAVGIKQIYTIGITKDDVLHATIHLFNRGAAPITDHEYIESFIKQAGIVIDRAKTAELLAESEEKYRLITENASDVIWVLNINTRRFTYISPAVMQLRGFTPKEAIAQTIEEAVTPESLIHIQQALEANLGKFMTNQLDMEYYMDEIQQPCKDGRIIWVEVSTTFRTNKQGEIEVVGVSRNIDERKKLEAAIKVNEQKFRLLFENSPLGIYIANTRGEILDANPALITILGSPSLEMTKKINVLELKTLQENGYTQQFLKCIETKKVVTIELPYTAHWGKKVYLSSYLVPMTNAQGNVEKIYTLMEDITLRKQNEEELIKLSLVAKQSPVSIVITNLDGNIEYVNSKFTEVTGYLPEEVIGQNPRILKSGDTPQEGYKSMWETITSGNEWSGIFHNKRKNGDLYWEKANILPVKTADGNPLYFLALKEDITEQLKAQDALIESETLLKEALAAKDKFFSIISHDLRSPFSTLVSFTELMSDDQTHFSVDEYKQYSRAIFKTAQSTYSLLENLLEWSRLQRGSIPFKPESIDINEFIKTCDPSIIEKMNAKQIEFEIQVEDNLTVQADKNMLHAILRNLMSNATKFTPLGGKIQLKIYTTTSKQTYFEIHDNGIGMPKHILENLFSISEKTSRPGTNNEPSSGLGLILCKEFVEMHGGKIWAESEEGKGSTFYFTIPKR